MNKRVVTTHIAEMYGAAQEIAAGLEGAPSFREFERALERIDNLVAHARAELMDEYLRLRDSWPVV